MTKEPTERGSKDSAGFAARPPGNRASREQTTDRILDAATELFAARNPRDVTVREVAEKAGVSHALVHQYVGSKDDLLNAVIQRVATDRVAIVRESAQLKDALELLTQQILTNRLHTKTLVRSAMDGIEYLSLKDRIATGHALIDLAGATAASGNRPAEPPGDIDSRVLTAAVTALLLGWGALEDWLWPVFDLDPADKQDIYRQVGEIVAYLADLVLQSGGPGASSSTRRTAAPTSRAD